MTVISGSEVEMAELPGRRSGDPLKKIESQSSCRIVALEPGSSRTAHRHPHSEEIMIVLEGRGRIWIEGESFPVKAGDVVQVPTNAAHATVCDEPVVLHCFFPHPDLSSNYVETDIVVDCRTGG